MIQGTVNAAYEAVVSLPLRGPAGQARDMDAVVDTGGCMQNRFAVMVSRSDVRASLDQQGNGASVRVERSRHVDRRPAQEVPRALRCLLQRPVVLQ